MSDNLTDFLIDPTRLENSVSGDTRAMLSQLLEFTDTSAPPPKEREKAIVQNLTPPPSFLPPTPVSTHIPALIGLTGRILQELETHLSRLLTLNPSRREAIARHLDQLSGLSSQPQAVKNLDTSGGLRRWIEGPRTPSQNRALKSYFEEVALIALGQAILLKSWSDRGVRKWSEGDLGRLNWALSTALKPHIPLDREGWQITRPNLYSWYNPSPVIQREIWVTLDSWKLLEEGPSFLSTLLGPVRRSQPEVFEPSGYDARFFKCFWEHAALLNLNTEPESAGLKRNRIFFCPTLRDGSLARTGSPTITWIGLENSAFQLMMTELMQIWWEPTPPPFWAIGTGLEVHARDQLALALSSPKPSVVSRISEMEACDGAFVLEEQIVRTQGKSHYSHRYKEQVESLPYFKRIRSAGTSMGDLQACVAITKLRPGGILVWAREEALSSKDGNEMLNFILDRAKLLWEWDFSELEHSLPSTVALYPRHFYVFQREIHIESRLSHRPTRISIQGQMRSHIELNLVLEEAFQTVIQPVAPRGQWNILAHASPTPQRDWGEKWPDPSSLSVVRNLDELRQASLPLAHFTTVRHTPEGDPSRNNQWNIQTSLKGFWITAEYDGEGRKLSVKPLPRPGQEAQGSGFLVIVSDETWIGPITSYLKSDLVRKWLDVHSERRGDRWILNEQVVKWLPIPRVLLRALRIPSAFEGETNSFYLPVPSEWEKLLAELSYQPQMVKEALSQLPFNTETQRIHGAAFIRASQTLDDLSSGQNRLFSLVTSDGRIRWRELMDVLPPSECVTVSLHPRVRLSGTLPPHLPIGKIERVKTPIPGILLSTESGFRLHIGSETSLLMNLIWEQLEGLSHPTWNELLQYLRLPRKIELAESTALEVLRSHGEQMARYKTLQEVLSICRLF